MNILFLLKLFSTIENELTELLENEMQETILNDVRYSGILDTTPDIAHVDQPSEVLRYVSIKGDFVEVVEIFVDFIELKDRK